MGSVQVWEVESGMVVTELAAEAVQVMAEVVPVAARGQEKPAARVVVAADRRVQIRVDYL